MRLKKYRLDRKIVEAVREGRSHGDQAVFVHKAVNYFIENHPLAKAVTAYSKPNRLNGASIEVEFTKDDWFNISSMLDVMANMSEGCLLQLCLQNYLEVLKNHGRPQIILEPEVNSVLEQ